MLPEIISLWFSKNHFFSWMIFCLNMTLVSWNPPFQSSHVHIMLNVGNSSAIYELITNKITISSDLKRLLICKRFTYLHKFKTFNILLNHSIITYIIQKYLILIRCLILLISHRLNLYPGCIKFISNGMCRRKINVNYTSYFWTF